MKFFVTYYGAANAPVSTHSIAGGTQTDSMTESHDITRRFANRLARDYRANGYHDVKVIPPMSDGGNYLVKRTNTYSETFVTDVHSGYLR